MSSRSPKIAELALALGMHDHLAPKMENGRVKGQLKRMARIVVDEYKKMGHVSDAERDDAAKILRRFIDASGWEGKGLHIVTKTNFMLALYDTPKRPHCRRLIEPLMEIYKHYAKAGDAPKACEWSGALAAEKLEACLK